VTPLPAHPRRRTRGILPVSGEERELAHSLGLSDDFLRDVDDLVFASSKRAVRTVFFLMLRKMKRAGCRRLPPAMLARLSGPAAPNGPTPETVARLEATLDHVATGAVAPMRGRRPKGGIVGIAPTS
jgi:hypothetical protein